MPKCSAMHDMQNNIIYKNYRAGSVGNSSIPIFALPAGTNLRVSLSCTHFMFCGTAPGTPLYIGHSISHPSAEIDVGGAPGSQIGFGRVPVIGALELTFN